MYTDEKREITSLVDVMSNGRAEIEFEAKDGVIQEVRKREHYEKPSVKRKKKSEAARKRKFR